MKKILLLTGLALLLIIGGLAGAKAMQIMALISAGETMTMPPSVVSTTIADEQEWEQILTSIGSMEAVQGVTITADIPGRITQIQFQSGEDIQEGDVVLQQDVTSEQAQLRAAEASVSLGKLSLQRTSELFKKKVSSESEFDQADAVYKEAVAQADTIRTSIEKKTIRAPFAGRLGIRLVNVGQDLGKGDAIVSLQAVDPILVNFYLPQQNLSKLELGLVVKLKSDAVPDKVFDGIISAINTEIDPTTRNVKIQATFKNTNKQLLPGMFANVDIILPKKDNVLVVPVTSVAYATFGDSVFVVTEKTDEASGKTELIAQQQFVQLGESRGDFVVVKKGLTAGTQVVSAGVFKLYNGSSIEVNNTIQADYKLLPTPEDS